jgi:hypothetical protein
LYILSKLKRRYVGYEKWLTKVKIISWHKTKLMSFKPQKYVIVSDLG